MANAKTIVAIATGCLVAAGVTIGIAVPSPHSRSTSSPSLSGAQLTCGTDVTSTLTTYFAGLSSDTNVNLPAGACLLVSNSASSLLTVNGLTNVTINGDGATLEQTSYPCNGVWQPILTLTANTNIAVKDLTIDGPASCGGAGNEQDVGIMVGTAATGNNGVAFSGVTIENTDGDGLGVYPKLATNQGINTNVVFKDGTLSNIGYHGVTLEGVDGFNFTGNTVTRVGNFMDLEVDAGCTSNCAPVPGQSGYFYDANGMPVGAAEWNVSVNNNTFTSGKGGYWIESTQACVPVENWAFQNNTFDSSTSAQIVINGPCPSGPTPVGLTITDNKSPDVLSTSGSIAKPPGAPYFEVGHFQNVTISGNQTTEMAGGTDYFPNTPWIPGVKLTNVNIAKVEDNTFNNGWVPYIDAGGNNGVLTCGNIYWLTDPMANAQGVTPPADPLADGTCP